MTTQANPVNTAGAPALVPVDIGHAEYFCLTEPDSAFWALVRKEKLAEALSSGKLLETYQGKSKAIAKEMHSLRFSQRPSAVYFNPTERCNLNCGYCYIPEKMRRDGHHMPEEKLLEALDRLSGFFSKTLPKGTTPQIIFHGAEPLLNRKAVFAGIERYKDVFQFGVQTNATLLDDEACDFLTSSGVSIGLSLDAATAKTANRARKGWRGEGAFDKVVAAMERLENYPNWSVICTITTGNVRQLTKVVEFFHAMKAPSCMLNVVRCTLKPSRKAKPSDALAARHYIAALNRTHELYAKTGQKLVVANFANILLAILAPTARRLMCDISPCGGGRCFFAVTPDGGLFPCSEFIGLNSFKGGNLFNDDIGEVLKGRAFGLVTGRKVEDVEHCRSCAIRHFCGSPCPAEAHEMNGGMDKRGAFCEFYAEQARYAFRLIADEKADDFLWDDWKKGTKNLINNPLSF